MMARLKSLPQFLNLLGWPGMVGIGLAAFAAMFYVTAYRPAEESATALETRLASLRAKPATKTVQREQPMGLAAIHEKLPGLEQVPDFLDRLFQIAEQQGVRLAKGNYKFLPGSAPGLASYRIDLPIAADYAGIRRFLAQAMNDYPALALDRLDIKRSRDENAAGVEATLRMTLFLRTAEVKAP